MKNKISAKLYRMIKQFSMKEFIMKNNLLPLTLAVTLGFATQDFLKAIIDDFLMPVIGSVLGNEQDWEDETIELGDIKLKVGHFLGKLLYYMLILFVVFAFIKVIKN